jgi:hypothetical protein
LPSSSGVEGVSLSLGERAGVRGNGVDACPVTVEFFIPPSCRKLINRWRALIRRAGGCGHCSRMMEPE